MKRTVKTDPYFYDQPEKEFLGDLMSPVHRECPPSFGTTERRAGEACVSGMYIESSFPDGEGLLETSFADFRRFLDVYKMAGDKYPLTVLCGETPCFEAWRLDVGESGAVITAADTEGVRRALVAIEGMLQSREGAYLPVGVREEQPRMKTRITRCFFSPINRPPKYGDELSDGIDYYPEEYLNRLMHDGVNGVWIYTRFSDLVPSSYLSEYGKGREARLEKLRAVCRKCARYGIRPYIFAIEPTSLTSEQMERLGDEVDGGEAYNKNRHFCVNSEKGRAFVAEAGKRLFESCPDLGGFISITYGERPTSCVSAYGEIPDIGLHTKMTCPRCRDLSPGQALANVVSVLCEGIHMANPNADVISWTYGHRMWTHDAVREYVRLSPDGAVLMQNFEEMGYASQLGKMRQGVDYWLSYAGPSRLFRATAEEAQRCGKTMFMKTQVCSSHEVATVPYVPVPGLLFDKYREAYKLGVTGVMQCWYFGNYPSMMSRAALELAFLSDFSDKRSFLEHLAGIYWGESRRAVIADAWEAFEDGYKNYPLNIMFSYYGPMHDGPVWELALKPKNFSLPRTWQTLDPTDGDRIHECLMTGHTLDEAITLCTAMSEKWEKGLEIMRSVVAESENEREQVRVAEALGILFASGTDILKFYRLRDLLGYGEGDLKEILAEMRRVVEREIVRSLKLSELCEADKRLGYHSEGEGYKFFPKKLMHRADMLRKLLETEFPEVEARIKNGQAPLAYYAGEEIDTWGYSLIFGDIENARWEKVGENSAFRASYDREDLILEWRASKGVNAVFDPEFEIMKPALPAQINADGEMTFADTTFIYYSLFGERAENHKAVWNIEKLPASEGILMRARLSRREIGWESDRPFKMRIEIGGELWCSEEEPVRHLGKRNLSPGDFGWLIPEK